MEFLGAEFDFDPEDRRLRCAPHLLNLVVKAMMYGTGKDDMEELVTPEEVAEAEETAALLQAEAIREVNADAAAHQRERRGTVPTAVTAEVLKRFRKEGPMGKLHNHGVCFNYSSQLVEMFKEAQASYPFHHPVNANG
jgi:hypothetical protein